MEKRSYFSVVLLSCYLLITIKTAMSTSEPVLIWAQRFGTWSKFRSLSGQPERLVSNSARSSDSQPQNRAQYSALSYNPRTDTMYWVDKSNLGFIMFQSRLQTFAWPAATPNKMNTFSNITKFTVDWATNNIYFIDSRDAISVITEQKGKTLMNVIHSINVDNPTSITCDVERGYLFWSDASARSPRIERSILNGDDRTILVGSPDTLKPSSIAIEGSNLFWVEESSSQVKSCDYNGGFLRTHVSFGANQTPRGIAASREIIFMTEESTLSLDMFWSGSGQKANTINLDAHPDNLVIAAVGDPNFKHECDDLPCERFCFNIGSNKGQCGCDDTENGNLCKGIPLIFSTPEKVFLASLETEINQLSASSSSINELKVYLSPSSKDKLNATFIDFHYTSKAFFWGEQPSGSIYSMRGVSQRVRSLTLKDSWEITAQQTHIEGLAVNWADSLLLWIDGSVGHIMGSKFNGDHHSIYVNDLMEPRALALDPIKGVLYWSQLNEDLKREIVSLNYRGDRSIQKLVQLDHRDVGDLVYDIQRGRLYWSDPFSRQIHCFKTDSKDVIILDSNIIYLEKFTVFMDIVIATHPLKIAPINEPLLFLNNKFGDKNLDLVDRVQFITNQTNLENEFYTGDVVIYGNYLQPNIKVASCARTNPCEQICLSAVDVSVCKCAIGYKEDGNKCQTNILGGPAIFFADSYHKRIYQMSSSSAAAKPSTKPIYEGLININSTFAFPCSPLIRPTQFVVDGVNGLVYIVDMNVLKVSEVSKNKLEVVYPTNENRDVPVKITQIALDKTDNIVYITDLLNRNIFTLDLNNKNISIWKKELVHPFAIAVDSSNRLVYWTEGGHLKSVNINDPNNVTLLDTLKNITSITIGSEENVIYVNDIEEGTIISYNRTDFSKNRLYQSKEWKIFKLTTDDNHIYFSCWNMRGVYRISKWNETSDAELISAPIFSRIVDIAFVPVFVQSSELSKLPIILGTLIPLLLLLLLLLFLLLFCLYRRKKNKPGPVEDPNHSSETMKDELVGLSTNEMFYPRLETISIIPAEWENYYDHIDDLGTPACQSEVSDNPLIVPLDVSLLPNKADIPLEGNSRSHLLGSKPKHSILRLPKRERMVDLDIETPDARATDHRFASANGEAPSPAIDSTRSDPNANPSQSDPSEVSIAAGPDGKPLNLIGPERGNGAPSGRFVLIPPKLHQPPRGFAPASRSVPTAFKNTWGRIKNAAKPMLNFGDISKC